MVMINNAHRGFDLHNVSQQSILHSFTEKGLPPSAASVFIDSDRAVAYVSGGAIRLWDIRSKSVLLSVPNPGESVLPVLRRGVTSIRVQEQSGLQLTAIDVSRSSILARGFSGLIEQGRVYVADGCPSNFAALATNGGSRGVHVKVWKGFTGKPTLSLSPVQSEPNPCNRQPQTAHPCTKLVL